MTSYSPFCEHCLGVSNNEIGETIVFCDEWDCWRNVTLGDCFNNCESQEVADGSEPPEWIEYVDTPDEYDPCYECSGYGDDYHFDEDGELVSSCPDCPLNEKEDE